MPALRWLFDDTRRTQLARDNGIGISTAYDYRDEAITVLTARANPRCTGCCWPPRPDTPT